MPPEVALHSIGHADRPIGVFDSGVGGLSVLRALRAELPREDFVYFSDAGWAPYGERSAAFVAQRAQAIAQELLERHRVKAIVVACNTATAAAVHELRARHPQLPVVGIEPALKPAAALTRTGRVAVLATRGTLASAKFRSLHDSLRDQAEFVLQPCDGLAAAIEAGDTAAVQGLCRDYVAACGPFGTRAGAADTLVLGCTHYPFALDAIREAAAPEVRFVETGAPVARQLRRRLEAATLLRESGGARMDWLTTGSSEALRAAAQRWLGL
jgi:glutamate racemase